MARLVRLEQGSREWLAWRSGGIGGSDAPIIMGVSPWSTPEQLWRRKTGREPKTPSNAAMDRGRRMEPVAREAYEIRTGVKVDPVCMVHASHDWMRGSLDGLSRDRNVVLEIKCPGWVDHEKALGGTVPEKYAPQLQHLLAVTGAPVCHYWSYRDDRGVLIEVLPDAAYIEELIRKERAFWECVVRDVPPVASPRRSSPRNRRTR